MKAPVPAPTTQAAPAADAAPTAALSLSALPGDSQLHSMREYLAEMMRVDLAPLHPDQPLHYRAALRMVPGASWGSSQASPVRTTRTAALCKDGQDDLMLVMPSAPMTIEQPGQSALRIQPGDAVLLSQARPLQIVLEEAGESWALRVPHRDMARMLPRLSSAPVLALRQGTPMLQLLQRFGRLLESDPLQGAASQRLAARQQHSLAVARLQAVRADIAAHLSTSRLSLEWLAARQGISARHLQRLLAAQGTSYQDAVRHARLEAARALLQAPRNAGLSITAIAHACGFSEASALSRAFRQHYGMTPGQARWEGGMGAKK